MNLLNRVIIATCTLLCSLDNFFYSKRLFTVAVDRSVPDKLDWWHKADKPSAVQDSGQRQCHTHQNAECPLLIYALDLEETYGHRENWKGERDKNRDFNCAHLSRRPTLSKTAKIVELFIFIYLSLTSFTSGSLEKSHCLSCIPRLSHSSGDIIKWSTAIDKLRMYEASDVTNSNLAWKVKKKIHYLFFSKTCWLIKNKTDFLNVESPPAVCALHCWSCQVVHWTEHQEYPAKGKRRSLVMSGMSWMARGCLGTQSPLFLHQFLALPPAASESLCW